MNVEPESISSGDNEATLVEEGEIAGDYLETFLDILDFDGDIDLDVGSDRALVSIDGAEDVSCLVGRDGKVVEALQELTRLAVQQSTGNRSRLMLDIAGWRVERKDALTQRAKIVIASVLATSEAIEMDPMSPFERKVVHDVVGESEGVRSESTGTQSQRRVVVIPD